MFARTLPAKLSALTGRFPVVFPAGPRQAGKTTLALATVPEFVCIPLEDLQNRREAGEDPRGSLPADAVSANRLMANDFRYQRSIPRRMCCPFEPPGVHWRPLESPPVLEMFWRRARRLIVVMGRPSDPNGPLDPTHQSARPRRTERTWLRRRNSDEV